MLACFAFVAGELCAFFFSDGWTDGCTFATLSEGHTFFFRRELVGLVPFFFLGGGVCEGAGAGLEQS